jgi:hypothetical protein
LVGILVVQMEISVVVVMVDEKDAAVVALWAVAKAYE